MTEQDKKKFKTVPAMDMDEYKQKIREHRLKILKRTLVTALQAYFSFWLCAITKILM